MRVEETNDWAATGKWSTPPSDGDCPWAGIALGPESDEGIVRVNGVLLQAGRALALRSRLYTIERVLGDAGAPLATVARMQVMLFEHASELAAEFPRANGLYGTRDQPAASDTVYAPVCRFPFTGRRQARVNLLASAPPASGDHKYQIVGRAYSPTTRTVTEHVLRQDVDFQAPDRASFVIGGTNEQECWHELSILVVTGDGVGVTVACDVETIGEAR